jgi:hypothetical protein
MQREINILLTLCVSSNTLSSFHKYILHSPYYKYIVIHSIWTLDIGRETIGNKTLQRRANVEPISRANVDPMSKMATGQRWYSTSNQRQRRPLTMVSRPISNVQILCIGRQDVCPDGMFDRWADVKSVIWIRHSIQASIASTHRHVHVFY